MRMVRGGEANDGHKEARLRRGVVLNVPAAQRILTVSKPRTLPTRVGWRTRPHNTFNTETHRDKAPNEQ